MWPEPRPEGSDAARSNLPGVRRSTLLIPLVAAAAATYVALVRAETAVRRTPGRPSSPPVPPAGHGDPVDPRVDRDAHRAPIEPGPSSPIEAIPTDDPRQTASPGESTDSAPEPDGPILDEGTFSIGGLAAGSGHTAISAVQFHQRVPVALDAARIALDVTASENVPAGGLMVLSDPGFAPDHEGFTLLLAAAAPGPFSASGTYRAIG